ncbi:hypothetical protein BEL01nite_63470 [Bradyrhizobium elkanii]|nr:hypothetical protein BEL01nite_63470 [Bradyrhizobium elkanii]
MRRLRSIQQSLHFRQSWLKCIILISQAAQARKRKHIYAHAKIENTKRRCASSHTVDSHTIPQCDATRLTVDESGTFERLEDQCLRGIRLIMHQRE